jgi:hypothetical protein
MHLAGQLQVLLGHVCVCVSVCVYMYVCVYIYIYICMYVCIYVYTYIHTYIHTYLHTYACMHTYIHSKYIHTIVKDDWKCPAGPYPDHTCIHTYTHTYTNTCIHKCIHNRTTGSAAGPHPDHTYMHACIHTYIHTTLLSAGRLEALLDHTQIIHTYIHTYIHTTQDDWKRCWTMSGNACNGVLPYYRVWSSWLILILSWLISLGIGACVAWLFYYVSAPTLACLDVAHHWMRTLANHGREMPRWWVMEGRCLDDE